MFDVRFEQFAVDGVDLVTVPYLLRPRHHQVLHITNFIAKWASLKLHFLMAASLGRQITYDGFPNLYTCLLRLLLLVPAIIDL